MVSVFLFRVVYEPEEYIALRNLNLVIVLVLTDHRFITRAPVSQRCGEEMKRGAIRVARHVAIN